MKQDMFVGVAGICTELKDPAMTQSEYVVVTGVIFDEYSPMNHAVNVRSGCTDHTGYVWLLRQNAASMQHSMHHSFIFSSWYHSALCGRADGSRLISSDHLPVRDSCAMALLCRAIGTNCLAAEHNEVMYTLNVTTMMATGQAVWTGTAFPEWKRVLSVFMPAFAINGM